ncbi:ubiquitin carboxyl-terminal hydrolase [Zalerion maritima]|uniref:ubiquitinyl hydrolase 1 n=1 Tax=Zalerion maritima TaxID=339359 RepID=A0AAD5RL65_9PEZI|nr:ubiquitin carboxyl-terminal hydrolase [Zalerion maritima]
MQSLTSQGDPVAPESWGSCSDDDDDDPVSEIYISDSEIGVGKQQISNVGDNIQTDPNHDPSAMQLDPSELVVAHNINENGVSPNHPEDAPIREGAEDLPDEPRADDFEAMKDTVYMSVAEEPLNVLDHQYNSWEVKNWRSLSKKEHGPIFMAGGYPWRILLFPFGNSVDQCSVYVEHAFGAEGMPEMPEDWSCCVQFALVMWNPSDPNLYHTHAAHHRFTKEEGDWGFTRFLELRKMFSMPWVHYDRPLVEQECVNITAYIKVVEDETGVLWHSLNNYDSKKETGLVGLKNQGATCYLNSLLQSLYFTNAFRRAVYQIPTDTEETLDNSAYTLQRLFYQLQTSRYAVDTRELTRSFGWETRHVFEQQDVQELSRKLMELLESKMKGTSAEKLLSNLFSAKLKTFVSCINVDFESSRVEDFWDVQLNVSGMQALNNSFNDYIEEEKLDGDNKYYAGDEHKLQDANKGVKFISFPDVLNLQLKRFQYDPERDTMAKINDRWEYPESFDASPFLADEADRSESWEYQLHSVLVHQGDLNAGHYYAFIRPQKDGWFYKFDDDKVTKARLGEVLEENYGGEYRHLRRGPLRNPKGQKVMRQNSAYMLVYIRKSRVDKVLPPVLDSDIPTHLRERFEQETAEKERIRREREEQHLYLNVKVAYMDTFKQYGGFDVADFNADPQEDPSAPRRFRLLRATTLEAFIQHLGSELGIDHRRLRLWVMVNRQNRTTRPDQPIMDMRPTLEDILRRSATARDPSLRLWVEEAEEVDDKGNAVWPSFATASQQAVQKPAAPILLFLKCFDVESQTLTGVETIYISTEKKVDDMVPLIRQKMGWGEKGEKGEKGSGEEKMLLWEEIKPNMIETLKAKQTLKAAELQDGDIVCFQRSFEKKTTLAKLGLEKSHESIPPRVPDHYEDAREFYEYLFHKRRLTLMPHPTRNNNAQDLPTLDMDFNTKMPYDQFATKVGDELGVEGTHIRFYTVNGANGNPKLPVKRLGPHSASLFNILYPTGNYSQMTMNQKNDALYYETLDMTLTELETMKVVQMTWLSEGVSKEERYDLLVNKVGTMEDVIEALIKKASLEGEEEAGKIRIYETSNYKWFKDLSRAYQVMAINDYTNLVAERIPEEEIHADESEVMLISVFHFHGEPSRPHSMPFRFRILEGEPFKKTKERLEKRIGLKGKNFERIKFAVVKRSQYSKPHYLGDGKCSLLNNFDDD